MPYISSALLANSSSTSFTTAAANMLGANCLLVGVYSTTNPSATTPTDSSGNTYVSVINNTLLSGSSVFLSVWVAANAAVSNSLTATWNPGSTVTAAVFVIGFSGRATSSPVDASTAAGGGSSVTGHSLAVVTPTADGDDLLSCWATSTSTTWTMENGWIIRGSASAVNSFASRDNVTFGPSYRDTFTSSAARSVVDIAIALLPQVPNPPAGIINELSR